MLNGKNQKRCFSRRLLQVCILSMYLPLSLVVWSDPQRFPGESALGQQPASHSKPPVHATAAAHFREAAPPACKETRVPSLIGHTETEAEKSLQSAHLRLGGVVDGESSLPLGTIYQQAPMAKQAAQCGVAVEIWVVAQSNKQGPPLSVRVPDVIGSQVDKAVQMLHAVQLHLNAQAAVNSKRPPDTILQQSPRAGSLAAPNSVVNVVVAQAPPVVVPNLLGQQQAGAVVILGRVGLAAGETSDEESTMTPGTVIRQDPLAGTQVPPKTPVNLVFGREVTYAVTLQSGQPSTGIGQPAHFTASTTPAPPDVVYRFFFGDGAITQWSGDPTSSHEYSDAKTYSVRAYAQINGKEVSSDLIQIEIHDSPVQVVLSSDKQRAEPGQSVQFTAAIDPPNDLATYSFDFGKGKSTNWSREPTVEHTFDSSGNYAVRVRARLGRGQTSASAPVLIVIPWLPPWVWWVGGGVAGVSLTAAACLYLRRLRKLRQILSAMQFLPRTDLGRQTSTFGDSRINLEVRIRAVPDPGRQLIEPQQPVSA